MKMQVDTSSDPALIVMRRTFDAPREVVWRAFTDPKHVVRWYGGHGFSNPVCEMDVRPGGLWRHVMRAPDGAEFAMEYVFLEVVPPEKISWQHADRGHAVAHGHPRPLMTVTFEEAGNQTKWTLVARFESPGDRALAIKMGFATVIGEGSEKLNDLAKGLVS
jgi:uncharacterized protein YndB with AHSA1/START domain